MQTPPLISVITPSYNQGRFIEETILSVIQQDYPNVEYIIIDGGSIDETVAVIKKYADKISYWVSEPDGGQSDAINKGLKIAKGDIVAWLNSDDCYEPGALTAVAHQFERTPDAGIVIGSVKNIFTTTDFQIHVNTFEAVDFMSRVAIHQPGVFWKRALNEKYGYLDPSFYYLMDQELWVRLFFNAKNIRTNKVVARFRVHDDAKTGKNPIGLYLDYRRIFSRFLNSLDDKTLKQKAIKLGIYDNESNIKYVIDAPPNAKQLRQIFENNIWNAALLEYRLGNIANTNKLVLQALDTNIYKRLNLLIKNNLRIGVIKKKLESK